jgi:hypothetical protein
VDGLYRALQPSRNFHSHPKIALVIDIEAKQLKFEADFTTSATVPARRLTRVD